MKIEIVEIERDIRYPYKYGNTWVGGGGGEAVLCFLTIKTVVFFSFRIVNKYRSFESLMLLADPAWLT